MSRPILRVDIVDFAFGLLTCFIKHNLCILRVTYV